MRGCVELWLPNERLHWIMVAFHIALFYLRTSILSVFYAIDCVRLLIRRFSLYTYSMTSTYITQIIVSWVVPLIDDFFQNEQLRQFWQTKVPASHLPGIKSFLEYCWIPLKYFKHSNHKNFKFSAGRFKKLV